MNRVSEAAGGKPARRGSRHGWSAVRRAGDTSVANAGPRNAVVAPAAGSSMPRVFRGLTSGLQPPIFFRVPRGMSGEGIRPRTVPGRWKAG